MSRTAVHAEGQLLQTNFNAHYGFSPRVCGNLDSSSATPTTQWSPNDLGAAVQGQLTTRGEGGQIIDTLLAHSTQRPSCSGTSSLCPHNELLHFLARRGPMGAGLVGGASDRASFTHARAHTRDTLVEQLLRGRLGRWVGGGGGYPRSGCPGLQYHLPPQGLAADWG